MKLQLIESSSGVQRYLDGIHENMTIAQFITRISEAYNYDRKKVKLLFKSQILNKHPEAR